MTEEICLSRPLFMERTTISIYSFFDVVVGVVAAFICLCFVDANLFLVKGMLECFSFFFVFFNCISFSALCSFAKSTCCDAHV